MIAKFVIGICKLPGIRKNFWKPIYNFLAKRFGHVKDWTFMNYGYAYPNNSVNGNGKLHLDGMDENNRYCIQMYHLVASVKNIEGLNVLEVGSGRGGGAHYVKKYLKPGKMTGLDISNKAVDFSNGNHSFEGLNYMEGNAEDLPFPESSFDLVINVESSHAYGSVEKFLSEVKRVLKPGGTFSISDVRPKEKMTTLKTHLEESGMVMHKETDISSNVVNAIELDNDRKLNQIDGEITGLLKKPFKEFAGTAGSHLHTALKTGKRVYKHFVLSKA